MQRFAIFALALIALTACAGAQSDAPAEAALETDDDKMLYTMGLVLERNIQDFQLTAEEAETVIQGFRDAVAGDPQLDLQEQGPKLQEFTVARMKVLAAQEHESGTNFRAEKASAEGAVRQDSGLIFRAITEGDGESPSATSQVRAHYHGTLRDGTVFDSSVDRGEPVEFALPQVIPCWQEALQLMQVGGKAEIVCPSDIAYGEAGRPPVIPGGATLVFEVELLDVMPAQSAS